jgi:hypothetical protein
VRIALDHRHAAAAELRAALLACALCGAADCLEILLTEAAASPRAPAGEAAAAAAAAVDAADDDGITLLMLATLHAHEVRRVSAGARASARQG